MTSAKISAGDRVRVSPSSASAVSGIGTVDAVDDDLATVVLDSGFPVEAPIANLTKLDAADL